MAETRNLVLEIGTEEIPARFFATALPQLRANAEKALKEARLDYTLADVFGSPRRLALYVKDLAMIQRDVEITAKGPAKKIAYDANGNPTVPAQKFAASQGVPVESLEIITDEKGGEYLYARRMEQGQSVAKVLPSLLASLVTSIDWPKSMRWADRTIRYARPIKWLLAIYGDRKVPFDVDGIETVQTTRGHRVLGPAEPIKVENADDYFVKVTNQGYVMVDQNVRRNVTWQQIQAEAKRVGGFVRMDEDLLEEINWLVEQPSAFTGGFDKAFLDVPPRVLVTTMKENQRYFPVYKAEDSEELLPYFIAVRNGERDGMDLVIRGNEKVLSARFADARFFWDEDRKQPLVSFNEKLKSVVFQEKLGTQYARVARIAKLARGIASALDLSAAEIVQAVQAAEVCKADLATKMVFEFPEVQGYMGQQYLLREGADPAVATAVWEHYLPRGAGDAVAKTGPGIAVAMADKLDTLAGFFSIGMIPTGSQDPFALRRAAQGVIQTIIENKLRVDLRQLCGFALEGYDLADEGALKALHDLASFFQARIKVQMEAVGVRYDVIDAVLTAGYTDATDAMARAEALNAMLGEESFAAVTGAFKRIANLAAKADEAGVKVGEVDVELFEQAQERELWGAFVEVRPDMKSALRNSDFRGFYGQIPQLKAAVDGFLDNVRVNADDEKVKTNRYSMLVAMAALISAPADLGRLAG